MPWNFYSQYQTTGTARLYGMIHCVKGRHHSSMYWIIHHKITICWGCNTSNDVADHFGTFLIPTNAHNPTCRQLNLEHFFKLTSPNSKNFFNKLILVIWHKCSNTAYTNVYNYFVTTFDKSFPLCEWKNKPKQVKREPCSQIVYWYPQDTRPNFTLKTQKPTEENIQSY